MTLSPAYVVPFYFLFLAAVWGASFMFMRVGAPEFGAYAFGGLRVGIAALVLLPVLLRKTYWQEFTANWFRLSAIGVLSMGIPFILFAYALYELSSGIASVINASTPVLTGVIAHFYFKQRLSLQQFVGLLIGMVGVGVLMLDGLQGGVSLKSFVAALSACLCYAIGSNLSKQYLAHISPMTTAASGLLAAGIATLPCVVMFFPDKHISQISLAAWASVIAIATVSTAIAMVMFYRLIQLLGATKTVSITLLIPVFGILWGMLLLGESLTPHMLVGTLIILLGTALTIFQPKKATTKPF